MTRIFVSAVNSLLGHALAAHLHAPLSGLPPLLVVGLLDHQDQAAAPPTVVKSFDAQTPFKDLLHVCNDSSVIVVETMCTDLDFVNRLACYLERTAFPTRKKIVVVSHALFWSESRGVTAGDRGHFAARRVLPCYQLHRLLEDRLLSIAEGNPSLDISLIVPGVVYGGGEEDLFPLFLDCLEERPLTVFGAGKNLVPLIDASALAAAVGRLCFSSYSQPVFYIAEEKRTSQRELVEGLAGFAGLQTREGDSITDVLREEYTVMTLDLCFVTSPELRDCLASDEGAVPRLPAVYSQFLSSRGVKPKFTFLVAPLWLLRRTGFVQQLAGAKQAETLDWDALIDTLRQSPRPGDALFAEEKEAEARQAAETAAEQAFQVALEEFAEAKGQKRRGISEPKREEFIALQRDDKPVKLVAELLARYIGLFKTKMENVLQISASNRDELCPLLELLEAQGLGASTFVIVRFSENLLEALEKEIAYSKPLCVELTAYRKSLFDEMTDLVIEKQFKCVEFEAEGWSAAIGLKSLEPVAFRPKAPSPLATSPTPFPETAPIDVPPDEQQAVNDTELESIQAQEEEEVALRAANLSQYISEKILPEISKVMVDICVKKPEDPVKFLIEALRESISSRD